MIVIPKETPIVKELNSFYLNIEKLFQYYQGVIDAGCVHFQLPSSEGVIFFDAFKLINGTYKDKASLIRGKEAIDFLFEESRSKKMMVSIYEILPERIAFWANVANAEDLYKDLSTEFTDLEGLIRKMTVDRLTGYIEVSFKGGDMGVLFLHNGQVVGTVSAESRWQLVRTEEMQNKLIEKSRKTGAILNVRKILLDQMSVNEMPGNGNMPRQTVESAVPPAAAGPATPRAVPQDDSQPLRIREMLQYLMLIYDKFIDTNKRIQPDFDTLLKRKFMQKVEKYDFLDPFMEDFKYEAGKIEYSGLVDDVHLATGLIECLNEIAEENDMQQWLDKSLWPLRQKYAREIEKVGVKL